MSALADPFAPTYTVVYALAGIFLIALYFRSHDRNCKNWTGNIRRSFARFRSAVIGCGRDRGKGVGSSSSSSSSSSNAGRCCCNRRRRLGSLPRNGGSGDYMSINDDGAPPRAAVSAMKMHASSDALKQ